MSQNPFRPAGGRRDAKRRLLRQADAAQTPPFLTTRRVVVVRDVGAYGTEALGPLLPGDSRRDVDGVVAALQLAYADAVKTAS